MSDDEDYIDVRPWPVAELVGQLVASVAVARRGMMEYDEGAEPFEAETDRFELESWAKLELGSWLVADELPILEAPVGQLTYDQELHCNARLTVASTIAWALRAGDIDDLPIRPNGAVEHQTVEWAPGPWTPVRNVVGRARLRSDDQLAAEVERWEVIVWRCELADASVPPDADAPTLDETIAEIEATGLLDVTDGDIALEDGTRFGSLKPEDIDELADVAAIRLQTLNWICGYGASPLTAPDVIGDDE